MDPPSARNLMEAFNVAEPQQAAGYMQASHFVEHDELRKKFRQFIQKWVPEGEVLNEDDGGFYMKELRRAWDKVCLMVIPPE